MDREKNVVIQVEDLTVAYKEQPVLWDLSAKIERASMTAILGPNGAGKSTLIKCIVGLLNPLSGSIRVFGKPFSEVYKSVAYVPQIGEVNWDFPTTVLDVVLMGRYAYCSRFRRTSKRDKELALSALKRLGMEDFQNRQISELSGGQRQRVFLARALCQDADIYILDEPLAGVDMKTEGLLIKLLKSFQAEGKTIIMVHHDLSTVKDYFSHVLLVNKGLVAEGSVEEVFTKENLERAYGRIQQEVFL